MNKWELEIDEIKFDYNGYVCLIKKVPELLHLCGYVLIPKTHILYNKSIDELNKILVVHGGITFADNLNENEYFIGFDCAQIYDIVPGICKLLPHYYDKPNWTYKDNIYVRKELEYLVDQIIKID